MTKALNEANHVNQYVLKMRKHFHLYPELGGMEERTSAKIRSELKKLKVEYEVVDDYSVIAFLK